MATPEQTPYNTYLGNGVTTEFSIGFNYTDTDSVKVYIKRSGGEEELLPNTDYSFVNATTLKFPASGSSETVLANGDVLTIQRETTVENDFVFSNQKRLFPEDVMEADDNEMRILQEHARQLGRALVLPPTSQIDPEDVIGQVERVYDSIDNIDTVADSISDVNNVSDNMTKVSDVSSNMTSVSGVYSNMSKITSVYNNRTNITAVANNSTNINTVAGDKANIDAVANNSTNINAVAGNATNINAVNANKTNIDTVASNISKVNNVSTNMTKVTGVYNNMSAITAVNSNATNINSCANNMVAILDAPNQAASAAASAELSAQYANDKINKTHITNCITEIPQDIKLELSSGTLTLKAGSKVYVPNGSGVFDVINVSSDKTYTNAGNGTFMLVRTPSGELGRGNNSSSGPTAPATPSNLDIWYDTTNNVVKSRLGSVWESGFSLPIAICTVSDGAISSIDQVFNGFGYIGSTVFVLPGVKGLIPDGRNADGTLKSVIDVNNSLITKTQTSDNDYAVVVGRGFLSSAAISNYRYDNETNKIYWYGNPTTSYFVGKLTVSGGKITNLNVKQPFRSVDYYDAVRTTGDQTIAGVKTHTDDMYIQKSGTGGRYYVKNTSLDLTNTSRTSNIGIGLRFFDKNDNIAGDIGGYYSTDGTTTVNLQARNRASGSQVTGTISVNVDKNGSVYTSAPTPATNDNSTKIATTAFVNNLKSIIVGWGVPDYSAGVAITSPYTPTKDGIITAKKDTGYSTAEIAITDGEVIARHQSADSGSSNNTIWAIVKSGTSYTINGGTITFYPFIGG